MTAHINAHQSTFT